MVLQNPPIEITKKNRASIARITNAMYSHMKRFSPIFYEFQKFVKEFESVASCKKVTFDAVIC